MKRSEVRRIVEKRIKEFERTGRSDWKRLFSELCFCILTANFRADKCIEIQRKIGSDFISLGEKQLEEKLRELGYRFSRSRAKYIVEARKYAKCLKIFLESFKSEEEAREWLVKNVKGLGMKEASHFLRNIGCKNLAILDFHVLSVLKRHGIIGEIPRNLGKKRYTEIEKKLREIAKELGISLAELDLYLWYLETGRITK